MNRTIVAAALMMVGVLGHGQTMPKQCAAPAIEHKVRQIAEQFKNGYNRGDANAVAGLYAPSATYLTQHFATGIVQGRENIRAYVQRGVDAKFHIDEIKVLSVGCTADVAYAITRYESTNNGEKAVGVNLVVLRKMGKRWWIVAHESAVPDPATAIQSLAPASR